MDGIPEVFTYKNEAYVIHIHRSMEFKAILDDICARWTLVKEHVELRCRIPEMSNSVMKLLNESDIDRVVGMHEILGSKLINVDVHVVGSEEVFSVRASGEQSSVNNNIGSNICGSSSQEARLRSDLWHDTIHSLGQIFISVEQLRNDLDLHVGQCTCREWQVKRLPCKHVCVVAHKIGCNVEEFCPLYFTTQCYKNCYFETIKPISNQDKPVLEFENVEVKPPITKRRAGRPKKKRIPSQQGLEGEKMTYTCSRCKQKGHNRKSCSNPIYE